MDNIGLVESELLGDASVYDAYGKKVEGAFQQMKQLADKAGWPAELSPEIVSIDREWQKAKEVANAAKRSPSYTGEPVFAKMEAMISRLEAYLKDRVAKASVSTAAAPPSESVLDMLKKPYGPLPLGGWIAAAAGGLLIVWGLVKKS